METKAVIYIKYQGSEMGVSVFAESARWRVRKGKTRAQGSQKRKSISSVSALAQSASGPLSCVREKMKIVLNHLPIRKCGWVRLEQCVELVEASGERWARAMRPCTLHTTASVCTRAAPQACLVWQQSHDRARALSQHTRVRFDSSDALLVPFP